MLGARQADERAKSVEETSAQGAQSGNLCFKHTLADKGRGSCEAPVRANQGAGCPRSWVESCRALV
jgi:hypothetical protein